MSSPTMDKQQRAAIYKSYMSREGPQELGSVTWPPAKPGCLKGLKFLSTGILESITREDLNELITDCGGHVMSTMSKKLDYLIVGRDPGPVKLEKATEWGLNQIREKGFLNFLTEKIENFDGSVPMDEGPKKGKKMPKKPKPERPKKKHGTKNKHESSDESEDDSSSSETSPSPKKKTKG